MLDYKSIIIKRYALGLSYKELAEEFSASKSANVKHFFTLLGKMFFTLYGKEFFTYPGKKIFTS